MTHRLLDLDRINMNLIPWVNEVGIEQKSIRIIDVLSWGDFLEHSFLTAGQALQCPPEF